MTTSRAEEIIAALWAIAALLAFGFGYDEWGLGFAVKTGFDLACVVYFGWKEIQQERLNKHQQGAMK